MPVRIPSQMTENVEEDIAICPLCYCPYYSQVEECPECTPFVVNDERILPEAEYANEAEDAGWFARLSRSFSGHVLRAIFRSNDK